ncbi:MAG: hypothetical protein WB755_06360 [Terriglobales bacterium]
MIASNSTHRALSGALCNLQGKTMTLANFAEKNRLKVKRDDCGDTIILGKQGYLYEYSATELGVMFMPPRTESEPWGRWRPKAWGNFKRAAAAAGMTLRQNGDTEGCLSFDPENKAQVKVALKIAQVRPKRQRTPEQIAKFVAAIQNARLKAPNSLQTGVLGA